MQVLCNVSIAHIYPSRRALYRKALIDGARVADSIANIEHDTRGQSLLIKTENWRWLDVELGHVEAFKKDLRGLLSVLKGVIGWLR